jgi:hypothetical protein
MAEFLSSDPEVQDAHPHSVYDLIANICHDGHPGEGLSWLVSNHTICIKSISLQIKEHTECTLDTQ